MTEVWERMQHETSAQYRAFCVYRDLSVELRSVDAAYCVDKEYEIGTKVASGTWRKWSVDNNWVHRAQLHDDYLERAARQQREQEHIDEIAEYQRTVGTLARGTLAMSTKMLQIAQKHLSVLERDIANGSPALTADKLPTWVRAMSDSMSVAMELWEQALGLDQLAMMLEQQEQAERASERAAHK